MTMIGRICIVLLVLSSVAESLFINSDSKNYWAFAALKADGSVVAWGDTSYGGSTSSVPAGSLSSGVVGIFGQADTSSAPYYTATTPYPVQPGSSIEQVFYGSNGVQRLASITFVTVSARGVTTIEPLVPSSVGYVALPAGYTALTPAVYYVATTATYAGTITVCLTYLPLTPGASPPALFHYTGSAWQDVTTSSNTGTRTVCGQTTSLSPFALAYGVSGSAASDPHLVGANGACVVCAAAMFSSCSRRAANVPAALGSFSSLQGNAAFWASFSIVGGAVSDPHLLGENGA